MSSAFRPDFSHRESDIWGQRALSSNSCNCSFYHLMIDLHWYSKPHFLWVWNHNLSNSERPPSTLVPWMGGTPPFCREKSQVLEGESGPWSVSMAHAHILQPPCSSPVLAIVHCPCRVLADICSFPWQSPPAPSFSYFHTLLPNERTLTCFSAVPFLL